MAFFPIQGKVGAVDQAACGSDGQRLFAHVCRARGLRRGKLHRTCWPTGTAFKGRPIATINGAIYGAGRFRQEQGITEKTTARGPGPFKRLRPGRDPTRRRLDGESGDRGGGDPRRRTSSAAISFGRLVCFVAEASPSSGNQPRRLDLRFTPARRSADGPGPPERGFFNRGIIFMKFFPVPLMETGRN